MLIKRGDVKILNILTQEEDEDLDKKAKKAAKLYRNIPKKIKTDKRADNKSEK